MSHTSSDTEWEREQKKYKSPFHRKHKEFNLIGKKNKSLTHWLDTLDSDTWTAIVFDGPLFWIIS